MQGLQCLMKTKAIKDFQSFIETDFLKPVKRRDSFSND